MHSQNANPESVKSAGESLRLSDLRPGQQAYLLELTDQLEEGLGRRLRELGFNPGTLLEVMHRAPGGDPLAVKVRGTLVALRNREAYEIEVVLDAKAGWEK